MDQVHDFIFVYLQGVWLSCYLTVEVPLRESCAAQGLYPFWDVYSRTHTKDERNLAEYVLGEGDGDG